MPHTGSLLNRRLHFEFGKNTMSTPAPDELMTKLLATATTYLQVFSTLDPDVIAPIQSESYYHEFAPASANLPPPRNREEFAEHIRHLKGVLRSFPVHAKQMWPNPALKQVLIWADAETEFHPHVRDNEDAEEWRYRGEYMFLLTMDQSGEKIERVLEFLDSKGTDRARGLFGRAWKMKGVEWSTWKA
ncbi:hypothetical protein MSAN_01875100 [Mycena sanguinolenta]|uniref:Uncharacterized protein n=1 Tax=Mycena sanguinolenta TaxID=230812 RepID=A0A8H6XTU2_9AGAR|nr:hypothetical protein MSAN_01875100 [Mycena sanguinolenta]